ncbi:protein max-like isoform X2 [Hemibagrus wyckioides]|uniref:protein max-like isoform X2 n=1 Tax=Hemibagrus wyckioides TaxID=337641 RepID=UPI00266D2414|nr:protein max-like isoform X2 [Hemibagrus wyckioides]
MRALRVVAQSRAPRLLESLLSHRGAVVFPVCSEYKWYFRRFQRMSDNDDIEVDSDEESSRFHPVADKRAHHNALERKRRDHIKDSFHSLRDSVPSLQGEKASRAQILDKATEYIQYMRRKNHTHQQDIDDLKKQNALLEQQVRALEKAKGNAQLQASYSSDSSLYTNPKGSAVSAFDGGSDSSSESEPEEPPTRKKLRVEPS